MSVSRKSPGEEEDIYELTPEYVQECKKVLQERSGYDVPSPSTLEQKAVDEKLPMGSQSY